MKIAYMIMAHTDPAQLQRLVTALHVDDVTHFYVHIDSKSDAAPFESVLADKSDVMFCKSRVNVSWGGYSQVVAYQSLMRDVVNSGIEYNRVFLLSGLDYPLWSNKQIMEYLTENADREFIRAKCITGTPMGAYKVKRYHFFRDADFGSHRFAARAVKAGSRWIMSALPFRKRDYIADGGKQKKIYFGSVWFALTGKCLQYVYDQLSTNSVWSCYFRHAYAPDELVVSSIVFNSEFAEKADLYTEDKNGLVNVTMLHYIEYYAGINTYDENDYDKLMHSGKMFVRKLVSGKSERLIEMIDRYRNG